MYVLTHVRMYSQRNTVKHEFIQTQDGSKSTKLSVQHGETIQQNDVVVRTRVNGLNEAVKKLETIQASGSKTRGRPACLGHEPVDEVPLRFYVQVSIQELDALVIPASFRDVLSLKTNMGPLPQKRRKPTITRSPWQFVVRNSVSISSSFSG